MPYGGKLEVPFPIVPKDSPLEVELHGEGRSLGMTRAPHLKLSYMGEGRSLGMARRGYP